MKRQHEQQGLPPPPPPTNGASSRVPAVDTSPLKISPLHITVFNNYRCTDSLHPMSPTLIQILSDLAPVGHLLHDLLCSGLCHFLHSAALCWHRIGSGMSGSADVLAVLGCRELGGAPQDPDGLRSRGRRRHRLRGALPASQLHTATLS